MGELPANASAPQLTPGRWIPFHEHERLMDARLDMAMWLGAACFVIGMLCAAAVFAGLVWVVLS